MIKAHLNTNLGLPFRLGRNYCRQMFIGAAALVAGLVGSYQTQAGQMLANPGFESGLNNWTVYSGVTWNYGTVTTAHTGAYALKLFGQYTGAANWSGVLQRFVSAPGCEYLASGFGFTLGTDRLLAGSQAWLEVSFRDSTNGILALYRSAVMDASTTPDLWLSLAVTNQFDPNTYEPIGTVSSLLAPANTAAVQFQVVHYQPVYDGGSEYWDDLTLNQIAGPTPPVITSLSPDGSSLFNIAATNFTFSVTSASTDIDPSGIHMAVNGADVSPLLTIGGTARNRTVSFGLQTNELYNISITVTDVIHFYSSASASFDTFSTNYYVWEGEDYNFSTNGVDGGAYINNPTPSSTPQPDSYFGVTGINGIDYLETGDSSGNKYYRPNELMATDVATDIPRQKFIATGASDYKVGWFDGGEWVNFTRDYPAGKFNVYARVDGGAGAATVDFSRVTGDVSTSNQTAQVLGSFSFVGRGWAAYDWVALKDSYGNLVSVDLGGRGTLRATTHGGADLNFFMLVPARLDRPQISNIYPNGTALFQATNELSFNVSSPSATIPAANIHLTLNGVDVSGQLTITGSANNKTVKYSWLKLNQSYTAAISVVDANGSVASSTVKFDTFAPVFTWEAEDWDYNGGQFIGSGAVCAYANLVGYEGIDYHDVNNQGNKPYRPGDSMSADNANDVVRTQFAGTNDYALGYFATSEWVNYTRNYPAGTYNLFGRFAAGGGTSYLRADLVTNGVGTAEQRLSPLGNFAVPNTGGWNTYGFAPLRDRFGNLAVVTLPASASTIRLTHSGGADANVNFLLLVPARTDLPTISCYPDGQTLLQGTNQFVFSARNADIPIAQGGLHLQLNGFDVTPQLTVSGTPNQWTASLPVVPNFTNYTAVVTVTDTSNQVASCTVYFDTFSSTSFTWEAEDWNYDNGQFVDNPEIDQYAAYTGQLGYDYFMDPATVPIDVTYVYRPGDLIGTEVCNDTSLPKYFAAAFTNAAVRNYDVGWWVAGEWMNFTRTYPAGNYWVYGRLSGGGAFQAQLDLVTAGATNFLGRFTGQGRGWALYDWVPMVDAGGQRAVISLGGVQQLRVTSGGGANANFFMLVPAQGPATPVQLTAGLSGAAVTLSFPTLSGYNYKVYYKADLADATWSLLTIVAGDGTIRSVSDTATAGKRFYRLGIE